MEERKQTGYPSIDKPWLKFYSEEAINAPLPEGTIYEYLWDNNKEYLKDIALVYFGKKISYGKMFDNIDCVEMALRSAGVTHGQIVTISLPSIPEVVYIVYALSKIGAVANIIDPRSNADMMKHYLNEAKSKVFIYLDKCAPVVNKIIDQTMVKTAVYISATESLLLAKLFDRKAEKSRKSISWKCFIASGRSKTTSEYIDNKDSEIPVLMTHTSGTTGLPKGVMLTSKNINALAHQYKVAIKHKRGQRYLCVIPPFIAFGVCAAIHMPITLGVTSVLIPKFDPNELYKLLLKYKPEHWICTPSSYEPLINNPAPIDLSFVLSPGTGGDSIESNYEQSINDYLKKHGCLYPILNGYGMTEVSSSSCVGWANCALDSSVGIPLVNMTISAFEIGTTRELSYCQEGEICFTGPNMMQGYYNNPDATAEAMILHDDGQIWMHSGDIGYITEDGHVYIVDRLKRAVSVDGKLVFPSKTENVLISHPDVIKCAVVGDRQSRLIAYIVLKPNKEKVSVQSQLEKSCEEQLSTYSRPYKYTFCDRIPLTPVGKVDYLALERGGQ